MELLIFAACVLFALAGLGAAKNAAWQPCPGQTQVPIYPGIAPDSQPVTVPETSSLLHVVALADTGRKQTFKFKEIP
jgi:hypothetical protein